jgi:uncharacterized protein (DUF1015 family)
MKIRAFQPLRPASGMEARVSCAPYDVMSTDEARALAQGNPDSLLRVKRAEIEFPKDMDPYSDPVYAKALENFKALIRRGALVRESCPCLYIYKLDWRDHSQTGVAAVCHVQDYENDFIRKHEKTRPEKEDDRTRLTNELSANPGPVFLAYRDSEEIDAIVATATKNRPEVSFNAPDGVRHTVWRLTDTQNLIDAFGRVSLAYVADGHHRSASAARVCRMRRASDPRYSGQEDYNWFLSVLFPAQQLKILPYNRLVLDLGGLENTEFLRRVNSRFNLAPATSPEPAGPGSAHMYLAGQWHKLSWHVEASASSVERLDACILQERLLSPILGIDDPRTSKRIEFVGGIRGTDELQKRVDSGSAAIAFSMSPTTMDQLMEIADAGITMPPKSTWFEPKLRSGLFIHTF